MRRLTPHCCVASGARIYDGCGFFEGAPFNYSLALFSLRQVEVINLYISVFLGLTQQISEKGKTTCCAESYSLLSLSDQHLEIRPPGLDNVNTLSPCSGRQGEIPGTPVDPYAIIFKSP